MKKKVNEFIVFCIKVYKADKNLSGKDVYELFKNKGVLEYLEDGYDILHTQGKDWIINDIDELLRTKS